MRLRPLSLPLDPQPGQALRPALETRAERAPRPAAPEAAALWLCIHLPCLPAEAVAADPGKPAAATEASGGRVLLCACNRAALTRGIRSDMSLAAALSLCADLDHRPRDPRAEARRLDTLAARALGFSSAVSLYGEQSIVLEIQGSLRLFGGLEALLARLKRELDAFGLEYVTALAPVPRAAFWLAQCRTGLAAPSAGNPASALRALPVEVLARDAKLLTRLQHSGIRTLGDLMRLPRDGLTRRFGAALLETLDQALARRSEPLDCFESPAAFSASRELSAPSRSLERITPVAARLLQRLESYLTERQAATRGIAFLLVHESIPASRVPVGCSRYARRAGYFLALLEERLQRLRLPAEVTGVTLRCEEIHRYHPESFDLFDAGPRHRQSWHQLIDQLQARLGEAALRRLAARADHRPEKACRPAPPAVSPESPARPPRPLWLLAEPEALADPGGQPRWHGPLELDPEVERIEQGWWDGEDIRRDYRIARNPAGARLWVYLDRRRRRWFLHGLFA